jgi:hypothetical protein
MESQRKQQGEMVDNQTANQTAKPLKKGKKKKNPHFWNSRITVSVVLVLLFSIQSCLSVSPRQFWSPPVVGSGQAKAWQACVVEAWQSGDLVGLCVGTWYSSYPASLHSMGLSGLWGRGPVGWISGRPVWCGLVEQWHGVACRARAGRAEIWQACRAGARRVLRGGDWPNGVVAPWAYWAGAWQPSYSFSKS